MNNPTPIYWCLEDREIRTIVTDFIRFVLRTPKISSFLGFKSFLKYRTPENLDTPWGWKDPRTTFTLPIWLEIFPNAKIIHVYRHGVDVANSLRVRRDKNVYTIQRRLNIYGWVYQFFWLWRHLPKRKELLDIRASTLDEGFSLWEEYIGEARKHVAHLKDRAFEVQFEHLLESPAEVLKKTADFCQLLCTQASLQQVIKGIKKERAYAYRSSQELQNLASRHSQRLYQYGY